MGVAALAIAALLGAPRPVPVPDGMICSRPPPPGTGLAADGRGLVHVMVAGTYVFHGALVNKTPGPRYYLAGAFGLVDPHTTRLEWTKPDGTREIVPPEALYPPYGVTP